MGNCFGVDKCSIFGVDVVVRNNYYNNGGYEEVVYNFTLEIEARIPCRGLWTFRPLYMQQWPFRSLAA